VASLKVGIVVISGAGLAQNKAVVVARCTSKGAELDREIVASRFLAAVAVAARRVPVAATFRALRRQRRHLVSNTKTLIYWPSTQSRTSSSL